MTLQDPMAQSPSANAAWKQSLFHITLLAALLEAGAMFGFFWAWVCSTMWGLDATDPDVAIRAMQAMNASVRNPTFAVGFFGTMPVLLLAAIAGFMARQHRAGILLALGFVLYTGGVVVLTMTVNVPMNLALGATVVPQDPALAAEIWQAYSPRWQVWNITRTVFSGVVLALVGLAMLKRQA